MEVWRCRLRPREDLTPLPLPAWAYGSVKVPAPSSGGSNPSSSSGLSVWKCEGAGSVSVTSSRFSAERSERMEVWRCRLRPCDLLAFLRGTIWAYGSVKVPAPSLWPPRASPRNDLSVWKCEGAGSVPVTSSRFSAERSERMEVWRCRLRPCDLLALLRGTIWAYGSVKVPAPSLWPPRASPRNDLSVWKCEGAGSVPVTSSRFSAERSERMEVWRCRLRLCDLLAFLRGTIWAYGSVKVPAPSLWPPRASPRNDLSVWKCEGAGSVPVTSSRFSAERSERMEVWRCRLRPCDLLAFLRGTIIAAHCWPRVAVSFRVNASASSVTARTKY